MEIFKIVPILKNLPLDIECIHAYDDYLLVGTRQGHLLMYKLVLRDFKADVHLLRSNKSFSKKPIQKMVAVSEFRILIALSDNVVSVHGLDQVAFPLLTTLSKTKGATIFVVDIQKRKTLTGEHQSTLRMCVVVKKKLILFYWKNNDFHEFNADLLVPDTPRVIAWSSESLCVGFRTEYCLIKVTGEQKDLFPTGKVPEPIVASLEGNRLALGRDQSTYFFDSEGSPILKYSISWSDIPIDIVDDSPYLLALLPSSVIEIRTIEPRLLIQTISNLSNLVPNRMKQLIKCTNRKGLFFISSNKDVLGLTAVSIQKQIPQVISQDQYHLALELAKLYPEDEQSTEDNEITNTKKETIKQIEKLQAIDFFNTRHFEKSMELFTKLDTDPTYVIGLYPDLLPEHYRNKIEYPLKILDLKGTDIENAINALIEFYLLPIRRKLHTSTDREDTSKELINDGASFFASKSIEKPKEQLKQIVDTTLLKCYLQTNDALISSLLRLPDNYCHLEETESALKQYHKYNELIILYQRKGMHRRALELLKKQSRKVNTHLSGYERTIQYLEHLGHTHMDLIFEFSSWVLEEFPEDGLQIFTDDNPETEQLPREVVLDYLIKIKPETVIPYLEHVISDWHDKNPYFHNTLANKYRERIRVLSEEYRNSLPEGQLPMVAGEEPGELGILRKKLLKFLRTSDYYSTETLPFFLINDGLWEERAVVMGKMRNDDEALTIYVHILNDIEKAEQYCEETYDKNIPGNRDVFLSLLKLYLTVPPPAFESSSDKENSLVKARKPNIEAAVKLLEKHATKIDPLRALFFLPPILQISSISSYLKTVTKYLLHERHDGQMFRNLLLAQHLYVQHQRIHVHRENKITVEEDDLCQFCQRRIGRSAFLRYPSKELIHYSCREKYDEFRDNMKY